MSIQSKAILWAAAIIASALLAANGLLPEPVGDVLITSLPALAVASLILPATARGNRCKWMRK